MTCTEYEKRDRGLANGKGWKPKTDLESGRLGLLHAHYAPRPASMHACSFGVDISHFRRFRCSSPPAAQYFSRGCWVRSGGKGSIGKIAYYCGFISASRRFFLGENGMVN